MKQKLTPGDWQTIARVGLGIAALITVKNLVGAITNPSKKSADQLVKDADLDVIKLEDKGVFPSYSSSQYNSFADQIYNAVITTNPFNPTDEESIFRIMGLLKNDSDFVKLVKAFGYKRLEFSTKTAPLQTHLQEDLTSEEIQKVNEILRSNNITYRI